MRLNGTEADERKRELRAAAGYRRESLPPEGRAERSARLCGAVVRDALEPLAGKAGRPLVVAVYGAFRSEADPSAVADWCRRHGHRVVAPRVRERGEGMELRTIESPSDWRPGRWNVPEPDPDRTALYPADAPLDVVLVPGLAFDAQGGRLGYGGGHYDRLYAERRMAVAAAHDGRDETLWIGFAFDAQRADQPLPQEAHDLPLSGLATEAGMLWFERGKADGASREDGRADAL